MSQRGRIEKEGGQWTSQWIERDGKLLGRAGVVVGGAADIITIARAPNPAPVLQRKIRAWGGAWLGGKVGAGAGAWLGAFGRPAAPVTVPAGACVGGVTGSVAGYLGGETLIRELQGIQNVKLHPAAGSPAGYVPQMKQDVFGPQFRGDKQTMAIERSNNAQRERMYQMLDK